MRYERAQTNNPHTLTIEQHVLPKAIIKRYTQANGKVSVYWRPKQNCESWKPIDPRFCVKRVWDQRTEEGYPKKLENDFDTLTKEIISGGKKMPDIGTVENQTISYFNQLWKWRFKANCTEFPNIKTGLQGCVSSKDKQEILEKNGYIFTSDDGIMQSRFLAGIHRMVQNIVLHRLGLLEKIWGIVKSETIEFIVPDSFGDIDIVPVSPNFCLVEKSLAYDLFPFLMRFFSANIGIAVISPKDAIEINKIAVREYCQYYFARDFSKSLPFVA
ncbi:MAG: hypothetical protein WCK32_04455 [Chlorobiaceae bacterium]